MSRQFIDVSHTIEDGMVTYKGLPAPRICDFLGRDESRKLYAPGTEFQISRIDIVANTGTYLDSPYHRYEDGKDLSNLLLTCLADLPTVVIRAPHQSSQAITRAAFAEVDLAGKAILIHTGWDEHWRTERYFEGHPYLTADAAEYLADAGAALVGIDSHNIDDTVGNRRPAHTILLGREIPIVEHLRGLGGLPDEGARFFAVPAKVKGVGTFPVRAFATLEQS